MERREYTRVKVGAQGEFFLFEDGKVVYDFVGIVDNVCEGGLGIHVEREVYETVGVSLEVGQRISFQAYDANGYSIREEEGIFHGNAEVVRKIMHDNILEIGCKIDDRSAEFMEYVKDKKVYLYISALNKKR